MHPRPACRGIGDQPGHSDRNGRPGMAGSTGLQQQYLVARVRRKSVRDGRTGRTGADNNVIVRLHGSCPLSPSTRLLRHYAKGRSSPRMPGVADPHRARRKQDQRAGLVIVARVPRIPVKDRAVHSRQIGRSTGTATLAAGRQMVHARAVYRQAHVPVASDRSGGRIPRSAGPASHVPRLFDERRGE
jgi:hypothetical protein